MIKNIELYDNVTVELRPGYSGTSVTVNDEQVFWSQSEEKARKFFDVYVETMTNQKTLASLISEIVELCYPSL